MTFKKYQEYFTIKNAIYFLSTIFILIGVYFIFTPRKLNIAKYYYILDQNEMKLEKAESEIQANYDIKKLDKCKIGGIGNSSELCYKEYFENYAAINGPKKSLEYLHQLIQEYPTIIPGCHYIAHGIGGGSLRFYKGDVGKAYSFDVAKIFSNVGACANGYYHGVSIEMTSKARNDDDVFNILNGFCDKRINDQDLGKEACAHGLGHAIMLYYDHELDKSTAMCKRVFKGKDEEWFFGCMTGVRMEFGMYLDLTGLWTEKGAKGIADLCKDYPLNTEEREACIIEGSGVVRYGEDYITAAKACQTLPTSIDRKACTKLTIIHAIRLGRSEQVVNICKYSKTTKEQIECTAYFANYLSLALDINKQKLFLDSMSDVCHTLNLLLYPKCLAIAYQPKIITFRSYLDRGLFLNFENIKSIVNYYKSFWKGCVRCGQKLINEEYSPINRM